MPIHKKLDKIGISKFMKEGSFDQDIYLKWLVTTYQFMKGYQNLTTQSEFINNKIYNFSPKQLGLSQIENDIKKIDSTFTLPQPLTFSEIHHLDLTSVPVYTLLGSLMGSEMIYRYIQRLDPDLPVDYLELILQNKGDWKNFKEYISNYQITVSEQKVSEYTSQFWEVIYQNYLLNFEYE